MFLVGEGMPRDDMPPGVELASSMRRWSTRPSGRRLHLGHHELAGRADHPRPGTGLPARAPQDDCCSGRAMHQVGRWSWGVRSARSSVRCAPSRRCTGAPARSRPGRVRRQQPALLFGRAAGATGALPTDQTVVFERFRDELGDWRVCVHCPLGTGVLSLGASC